MFPVNNEGSITGAADSPETAAEAVALFNSSLKLTLLVEVFIFIGKRLWISAIFLFNIAETSGKSGIFIPYLLYMIISESESY
jgi:hypothetical protein